MTVTDRELLLQQIEDSCRRDFERTLPDRVRRAADLNYSKIIGSHYFAHASWECLRLYRDGFHLGAVMATQAMVEALIRFVAERSRMNRTGNLEKLVGQLMQSKILSNAASEATLRVWRHRNDFHHLNPVISAIDQEARARDCVDGLCVLEDEIFGGRIEKGTLIPKNPQFYDITDGTAPVSLRQFNA